MTPEDKARIEEIRKSWINGVEPVPFLLARLDNLTKTHDLLIQKYSEVKTQRDEIASQLEKLKAESNEKSRDYIRLYEDYTKLRLEKK